MNVVIATTRNPQKVPGLINAARPGCEAALHAQTVASIASSESWDRIYYGNEFCHYLMPSVEELQDLVLEAGKICRPLTLLTPPVGEDFLDRAESLLSFLSESLPDAEVVYNDWGVLRLCRQYGLKPVQGRLLNKQRRDPRILPYFDELPSGAQQRMRQMGLSKQAVSFLEGLGVSRVELDVLDQGVEDEFTGTGIAVSLYWPYAVVTNTRDCVFNRGGLGARSCAQECRGGGYKLAHSSVPGGLLLKGNTQFYKSSRSIPEVLSYPFVTRFVFQPDLPI
ncbi:MAG: hypothetical protein JW937_01735 [Candidatus Omnitrophica bacterium]|nr:hypothetical protein [Candidatus Omnitrophota bacterium]